MQILSQNSKKGEIKVKIDNADDLWYLSHTIDIGDFVRGHAVRKIKVGGEEKSESVKRHVFVEIKVEKIDFQESALKLLGPVKEGTEDIPKGSYQSINAEIGSIITIVKEAWLRHQLEKLKEAEKSDQSKILICILDRETAIFAISKRSSYELLATVEGEVQKKEEKAVAKGSFYQEIINLLEEYSNRYKVNNIIVASPVFWKEELMRHIKDENLKKKVVLAACSSVTKNAVDEVLKRPEVREVLKQVRIAKELNLVDEFLRELAKKQAVAYGIKEVANASELGAVRTLLVTDSFIHNIREKENYSELDRIMRSVDKAKGEIHIISSEHESGKKIDGLGGICAILRYSIT
jgi:protein pelota